MMKIKRQQRSQTSKSQNIKEKQKPSSERPNEEAAFNFHSEKTENNKKRSKNIPLDSKYHFGHTLDVG